MAKPETITSSANQLLKEVRRAISRGSLTEQGWCVAETFHLLEEALRSECEVKTVLAAESALAATETHLGRLPVKLVVLPDTLFASVAATETSQGVIALVKPPAWKLEQLFGSAPLVVVLDGLQDPGNAGTIVRAAEAFGATGILFLKGTVSPYNSKTLRAAAGSLFRVPFLHGMEADAALAALQENRVELFAGVPTGSKKPAFQLTTVDLTGRCGLIIGSEAHGVSDGLRAAAIDVTIPTAGVESLNAAVAAGILLYEARRQRMLRP
ncbi:MAG TPA: RNA methyltransferase [Acetobacteraceae bacterium]|nr:RNA methyltransferase [Acetobacteraceae bacterium]